MRSRNNLIIGLIAVIVLVGAYYAFRTAAENTPSATPSDTVVGDSQPSLPAAESSVSGARDEVSQEVIVEYTDSGFSPKSINVTAGTQVTWVNNSSDAVWVASDPHPTHTDLPGFDAKREIAPGETYTYTFTTVGNHGYHNHLDRVQNGTVVVE